MHSAETRSGGASNLGPNASHKHTQVSHKIPAATVASSSTGAAHFPGAPSATTTGGGGPHSQGHSGAQRKRSSGLAGPGPWVARRSEARLAYVMRAGP